MSNSSSSNKSEATVPLGFAHHDHAACKHDAIATAKSACEARGLRFTAVRRKVLEILLREHRALGAYDILDDLKKAGFGSQPPVAYRALDFLIENGFVHRIERLNAFIACALPGERHNPAFMICRACDTVAETGTRPGRGSLSSAARASGFQIESTMVEAEGLCPDCADKGAQ